MNKSGFYKNHNGYLVYAPNFVLNKNYELRKENKENIKFPIDEWYWFESTEDAIANLHVDFYKETPTE